MGILKKFRVKVLGVTYDPPLLRLHPPTVPHSSPLSPAGDPTPADTAAILDALVEGGADIIELGMPFTDPMADGPIDPGSQYPQPGGRHENGRYFCHRQAQFRERHPDTPLVLMGYANPMTIRGADWFADQCAAAGVDGVICVDIPTEEDDSLGPALRAQGYRNVIRLATPTTDEARLPAVLNNASGLSLLCLGRRALPACNRRRRTALKKRLPG